ncbi:MAG: ester cyclase [Proteobacteria bacterium]|nr:ester cyclase [Pseudomonadota bacterium]
MSTNRRLIEDFYYKVWNAGDEKTAHRILAPHLAFRGSTGPSKSGVAEFLDYVRLIRNALGNYECVIDELVTEGDRSFAKMIFRGIHVGTLFGVEPTGQQIEWAGAALFRIHDAQISHIWVLGDVDSLKNQLGLVEEISP